MTTCVPGAIGNAFGFWINNGTTTTTVLNGFRASKSVKTNGTANTAAVFETLIGTYGVALKSGFTITSYATA